MAHSFNNHPTIDLDHRTSAAVCNGIGERLRDALRSTSAAPLPDTLKTLVERLADVEDAPSVVPEPRQHRR